MFASKKIAVDSKVAEAKPPVINQKYVVYKFKCDLCDADCVSYTRLHRFQPIEEHKLLENTCVTLTVRETKIFTKLDL